jgi:DNA replication protein DnaD
MATRSVDFIKHALSTGNNMEEAKAQFTLGFARVYNEITTAILTRFKAQQEARVIEFESEVKVILSKLEVSKMNSQIELAYNDQILRQWEIASSQSIERVKALIDQNYKEAEVQIASANHLGTLYASLSSAAASQITGLVGATEYTDLT